MRLKKELDDNNITQPVNHHVSSAFIKVFSMV
jgi:hypothetical protein